MSRRTALIVSLAAILGQFSVSRAAPPPPKSPEESLRAIHLRPGMQVELVASEPLVGDPIAVAWGPDGRMWVVEMGDYPLGVDGKGGAGGLVRVLEDTDGDGRYDKATTFLDKLAFPTGVLPWRRGVLVTCAPDIFYAEDTDGDGKADKREVLFSGFPERNQQHRVNGLQWGLDNWVHCANGDGGVGGATVIECRKHGGKRIELGSRDFRFRPDTGELDPQTGTTQFGRNRDDWGNWFGSNNAQPLYHFVLPDQYLRRNPQAASPDPRRHLLTVQGPFFGRAANVPIRGETTARNSGPYRVGLGGPCSGVIYRDNLLGSEFTGNAFVCDPVTNLVHRELLTRRGPTFSSQRAPDETAAEFFASSDSWTRPTMARTGPDGALWIVDMYRLVIEHPQWIAPSALKQLDLRAGHDLGRIYRVWPQGIRPRQIPNLDQRTTAELVAALDSPSGWQRDMVQQLLLWRADPGAVAPLEALARTSRNPLARLHALCTLEGLGSLTSKLVEQALHDEHPEICCNALRLAEPFLKSGSLLATDLEPLVKHPAEHVRLQLAFTLGELPDKRLDLLAELAFRGADEPYLNAALLSSLRSDGVGGFLARLINPNYEKRQGILPQLIQQTATMAGSIAGAKEDDLKRVETALMELFTTRNHWTPWKLNAIAAWFEGGGDRRPLSPQLRPLAEKAIQDARKLAGSETTSVPLRMAALGLLGRDPATRKADLEALVALISPQQPPDVQTAAAERLLQIDSDQVPTLLLAGWSGYLPGIRSRILEKLLSRDKWAAELVAALEAGTVAVGDLDAPRRQRMRDHSSPVVRQAAQRLFVQTTSSERQKIIERYRAEITRMDPAAADIPIGKQLFEKRCSICHRLGQVGHSVGPDLTSSISKPLDEWLIALIDPNRAVEPRYTSYTLTTRYGTTVSGIMHIQTDAWLKLLLPNAETAMLHRYQIEEMTNSGKSLMPEGFENDLKPVDTAHLLAYIRRFGRGQRKVVAGNQPELVQADPDGDIRLLPATCEIFGDKVTVDPKSNCIVGLSHTNDLLVWNFDSPRTREMDLIIQYAPSDQKSHRFTIELGAQEVSGLFRPLPAKNHFRNALFGKLLVTAGRSRLTLRRAGKIEGDLATLKAIILSPARPDE